MTVTVEFAPVGRRLEVEPGCTVLQAAREVLPLDTGGVSAPCGGQGLCGRCRVRLVQGELSPPGELEQELLGSRELAEGYRLACQAVILGPVRLEIPPETLAGRQSLQVAGAGAEIVPDPLVRVYHVPLRATAVEFPFSTWQQVEAHLRREHGIDDISIDPDLLEQVDMLAEPSSLAVAVRGREIIHAGPARQVSSPLGLAVDLGTTKMAGFLLDLESGRTLAADGILNPQISYGEDVISRLAFALEGEEQYRQITRVLREGLNRLLQSLCERAEVRPDEVLEAVLVGNTAMHHLLLGLPVHQLARSPYVPATTLPLEVRAYRLGLGMARGAVVHLVPAVAGFVGGDHVAMILSSRIPEATGVTLGLDIGTNTEIVLARDGQMISCSCASGPAFEGAHIQQGMRAVDGAVSKVLLRDGGREVHWETIGGKAPVGICGSGILDAVAELHRVGVIGVSGRLDTAHPRVRRNSETRVAEFVLVPAGENGAVRDIVVTQKDISEIQLAKAAIAAGTQLLLGRAGLSHTDIDRVVVAGAFGTHLQLASAIAIGMLPDLPQERFQQVGNAAGAGARMVLLSAAERRRAVDIARRIRYIELAALPEFNDIYLDQIGFPG